MTGCNVRTCQVFGVSASDREMYKSKATAPASITKS